MQILVVVWNTRNQKEKRNWKESKQAWKSAVDDEADNHEESYRSSKAERVHGEQRRGIHVVVYYYITP